MFLSQVMKNKFSEAAAGYGFINYQNDQVSCLLGWSRKGFHKKTLAGGADGDAQVEREDDAEHEPAGKVEAQPLEQPAAAGGEEPQRVGGRPHPRGAHAPPPCQPHISNHLLLGIILMLVAQIDDLQLYQFFSKRFQSLVSAKGGWQSCFLSANHL